MLGFQIKDTQCGFKIFSRDAAKLVFPTQHLERWAFDIELLFLCSRKGIEIREVPVTWHEVEGSHLSIIDASLSIIRDMMLVKFLYSCGCWRLNDLSY